MDTRKDAKLTVDRKPTTTESLDALLSCMGGNRIWKGNRALGTLCHVLLRDHVGRATLLRKRLARGGRIVKNPCLEAPGNGAAWITTFQNGAAWVETYLKDTAEPQSRTARIAVLTAMELPYEHRGALACHLIPRLKAAA